MRTTRLLGATLPLGLLLLSVGCVETIAHPASAPRPDPEQSASAVRETRRGDPEIAVSTSRATVDIAVAEPTMCRSTQVVPAVRDRETERSLTIGGWVGQALLLSGAAGAGVFGGYMLANPCTVAEGVGAPCVSGAQKVNQGLGIGSLVVAGALTTVFVANGLSTLDSTDTEETSPLRYPGSWRVCGSTPVAGVPVEVWFSNGYVATLETGDDGVARLDLQRIPEAPAFVSYPKARVRLADRDVGVMVFSGTDLFDRSRQADERMRALFEPVAPVEPPPVAVPVAGLTPVLDP